MTVQPPTLEHPKEAVGSPSPEDLFKEARHRRRRRWAVGTSIVVVVATVAVGLGVTGNGGNRPTRTSPPSPQRGSPSTPAKPTPKSGTPLSLTEPRILTVAYFNPTDGYGLFQSGTRTTCVLDVAPTKDGGGQFAPLVKLPGCEASHLAFDDHGDGFAYAPDLYATHDSGKTWSPVAQPSPVLSVEALGSSIWMLEAVCAHSATTSTSTSTYSKTCRPKVVESVDGGRTWASSPSQPGPGLLGGTGPYESSPGALVRTATTSAYVVGIPPNSTTVNRPVTTTGAAPLWFTEDGGRTWVTESIPCGFPGGAKPVSATVSAAPDGTLFTVCGYFTQLGGMEDKAVFVSTDDGVSWASRGSCFIALSAPSAACPAGSLEDGRLGILDAVSATTAFELGQRGNLLETTNGGDTWSAWTSPGETLVDTGPPQLVFFDAAHGVVLAQTKIWQTSDGGVGWAPLVPVASGTTASSTAPCAARQLRVSRGTRTVADGRVKNAILLTNAGGTCTLRGFPLLTGSSSAGQGKALFVGDGASWFGTLIPVRLAHGEHGQLWLQSTTTCRGPKIGHIDDLVAGLPGAGGTLSLGAFSFTGGCVISESQLGSPPTPAAALGSAASLKVEIQPQLSGPKLPFVASGSLLHYTVRLYNLTGATVVLDPCPRYTAIFSADTTTSNAERVLARHTATFACGKVGSIRPGGTAQLGLTVRVPKVGTTTAGFVWKFDLAGVPTSPRTTSATGIAASGMKIATARIASENGAK